MLLGGDELGRTQQGNNNAYCQDNELSWFDWEHVDVELLAFTRELIAFRRGPPDVPPAPLLPGAPTARQRRDRPGVVHRGGDTDGGRPLERRPARRARRCSWVASTSRSTPAARRCTDDDVLWFVNPSPDDVSFCIPPEHVGAHVGPWLLAVDTAAGVVDPAEPVSFGEVGQPIAVTGRSLMVLRRPRAGDGGATS